MMEEIHLTWKWIWREWAGRRIRLRCPSSAASRTVDAEGSAWNAPTWGFATTEMFVGRWDRNCLPHRQGRSGTSQSHCMQRRKDFCSVRHATMRRRVWQNDFMSLWRLCWNVSTCLSDYMKCHGSEGFIVSIWSDQTTAVF
jgi:hypothetical protein